eukprot:TRINITY_DN6479_c0_g1_i2.p4 TRINITY_DN6479_c0_g1~~TRINITY_DN6479_c0_g1_i2.p4  ORF type:complete len:113 (+),score=19.23 TRINITY_DN6479_c0_g1_i2:213-551(+)
METAVSPNTVLWLAFALAFVFGAIAQKTHFCTMGAVADIVNMGDWSRMRMWLLAIGVAVLGAGALHAAGLIDLGKSIYRTPKRQRKRKKKTTENQKEKNPKKRLKRYEKQQR